MKSGKEQETPSSHGAQEIRRPTTAGKQKANTLTACNTTASSAQQYPEQISSSQKRPSSKGRVAKKNYIASSELSPAKRAKSPTYNNEDVVLFDSAERQRILYQFDKDMAIKDRFTLMAWGLQRKASFVRIRVFLQTVNELKRRFNKIANMFLVKKGKQEEQQELDDFEELIENFDKRDNYVLNFKKERLKTLGKEQAKLT